jgi:hypothetical protein
MFLGSVDEIRDFKGFFVAVLFSLQNSGGITPTLFFAVNAIRI